MRGGRCRLYCFNDIGEHRVPVSPRIYLDLYTVARNLKHWQGPHLARLTISGMARMDFRFEYSEETFLLPGLLPGHSFAVVHSPRYVTGRYYDVAFLTLSLYRLG